MYKFSVHEIKNKKVFEMAYGGFIKWCKSKSTSGTFTTYCDGEPVFLSCGIEVPYSTYKATLNK